MLHLCTIAALSKPDALARGKRKALKPIKTRRVSFDGAPFKWPCRAVGDYPRAAITFRS